MSEGRRTTFVGAIAAILVGLVWLTSPRSNAVPVDGRGTGVLFPEFTDPAAAASLEVVEFDQEALLARPFKVVHRDGRWTIPSHENYPADGDTQLAPIAAAVAALKADEVVGDRLTDQERCGVLDPLDETLASPTGRGTRITVRGVNDRVLADVILGKSVEGRPAYRYVRVPSARWIHVARIDDLQVSTRFEDWIERNVLQVERGDIDRILIRDYVTDPTTGRAEDRGLLSLRTTGADGWALDGMGPREKVATFNVNLLVTRLVDLAIAGVRRKPPAIAALLTSAEGGGRVSRPDAEELASRGFYFTASGRMQSSQGEVLVHTKQGIFYVLQFGAVAHGADVASTLADQRYVFISVGFDPSATQGQVDADTRAKLELLRARFAPWYYVVSNDSFQKIRLSRDALVTR